MSHAGGSRLREHAVFVAVVVAVLAASPLHLPLNNPNEGVRVFVAKALVERGTFAIDEVVREWGYIDDKATHEGRLYSSKAPLMSVLGAAAYAVVHPFTGDLPRPALTRVCRGAGDVLPSLVAAWFLWRALRKRVRDGVVADLTLVGTVLGSGVLAAMNVFSGHALAALAPAAALALVVFYADDEDRRPWHLPVAGLLLAAAVGAEYPALLVCVPIVLVTLVVEKKAGRDPLRAFLHLTLGALPVVVIVCVAHTAMFGAPWRTGYSSLENPAYRDVVAGTLFGIGAPDFGVLGTVLVSPELGLFFGSPFLIVGLGWALARAAPIAGGAERALMLTVIVGVVLMLLFIAGFRGWRGGWSVGPRYISEVIGLLALPTALAFDRLSTTRPLLARASLAALVAVALVHSGVAGMFFPHLPDVYRNPVYEMMLPLVVRGLSPDSVFLAVGLPAGASTALLLLVLAHALLAALKPAGGRSLAVSLSAATLAVVLVLVVGPHVARTDPARKALETRRLVDNWRPERGVPILALASSSGSVDDPRVLLAVDRARVAWPGLLAGGCASAPSTSVHTWLRVPALDQGGTLVIVPDRFADRLLDTVGAPAIVATRSDVERFGKRGIPCSHVLLLATPGEPPPRPLSTWTVREVTAVDDGLELRALDRT